VKKGESVIFKRRGADKIRFAAVFVLFTLYALALLFPYAFAFNAALKESGRAFMRDMVSISKPAKWDNFILVFKEFEVADNSYLMTLFNSLWYSIGGALINLTVLTMSSYVISKYKFKGRNFLYNLMIITLLLPIVGAGPALYRLLYDLRIKETPFILLIFTGGLMSLIIYAYFAAIPWEYAESAFIDGAGHFVVFAKIMLPQALPALSVIFIMNVVGNWNDYATPILYLNRSYPTIASGLYLFQEKIRYNAAHPIFFAGALIAALPLVILFALLQNILMNKVFLGGIKG